MSSEVVFKILEIHPGSRLLIHPCPDTPIAVKRDADGLKLVASRAIPAGSTVLRLTGVTTDCPSRYSIQVGEHLHLHPRDGSPRERLDRHPWQFLNHSCEPNTWMRHDEMVALTDIDPWDDVTFDYNTTEWDMAEPFACRCAGSRCAGRIRGFRHLTPSEQERLRAQLSPHLLRRLPPQRARRAGAAL